MITLPEVTSVELARRVVLAGNSTHVSAVVVDESDLVDEAARIHQEVEAVGVVVADARLERDLQDVARAQREHPDSALLLVGGGALDEDFWQHIDLLRTRLHHRGVTLLLLSEREANALMRAAPHLASWLSGSMWRRARGREYVEALVRAGRVGEARELADKRQQAGYGPIASMLKLPKATSGPASGKGDFSESAGWLREHQTEYAGKWVALRGGELVDSDESLTRLQGRLRSLPDLDDLLFVKAED